jgi:hypothetical protein
MRFPVVAMVLAVVALGGVLDLCSCAPQVKSVWLRTDGQHIASNPVLLQQAQVDLTVCQGEMQKANLSGVTFTGGGLAGLAAAAQRNNAAADVAKGCMAQHGYILVPEDQAEAKSAELAALNTAQAQAQTPPSSRSKTVAH